MKTNLCHEDVIFLLNIFVYTYLLLLITMIVDSVIYISGFLCCKNDIVMLSCGFTVIAVVQYVSTRILINI